MVYWTLFGESDYEKVQKLKTAAKIAAATAVAVLTAWTIAAVITGSKKDGKPAAFMQETVTALCQWMLQNQIATFITLSASFAANTGVLAGLAYLAGKKVQQKCDEKRYLRDEEAEFSADNSGRSPRYL